MNENITNLYKQIKDEVHSISEIVEEKDLEKLNNIQSNIITLSEYVAEHNNDSIYQPIISDVISMTNNVISKLQHSKRNYGIQIINLEKHKLAINSYNKSNGK